MGKHRSSARYVGCNSAQRCRASTSSTFFRSTLPPALLAAVQTYVMSGTWAQQASARMLHCSMAAIALIKRLRLQHHQTAWQ